MEKENLKILIDERTTNIGSLSERLFGDPRTNQSGKLVKIEELLDLIIDSANNKKDLNKIKTILKKTIRVALVSGIDDLNIEYQRLFELYERYVKQLKGKIVDYDEKNKKVRVVDRNGNAGPWIDYNEVG